jgi:DNA-binding transcriptional regulator YiaG
MWLTKYNSPKDRKEVDFGAALKRFVHHRGEATAKIRITYFNELLDRRYDEVGSILDKILMIMKNEGLGFSFESFYNYMDRWDDVDSEAKRELARCMWAPELVEEASQDDAARLLSIRKQLGLSQTEFHQWLVPNAPNTFRTIADWEGGKRAIPDWVWEMCRVKGAL